MKKLLIFLGVMLMSAVVYAGIIYDNTTDDISSSSGSMTIDGSPIGGGMTNTNGTQGINNIDAANEEIQRNQDIVITTASAISITQMGSSAITFGEAFSATPMVVVGPGSDSDITFCGGVSVTTTGFTLFAGSDTNVTVTCSWLALGD